MHGQDFELDVLVGRIALGELLVEQLHESVPVLEQALVFGRRERVQEGGGVAPFRVGITQDMRPAQAPPGAFHQVSHGALAPQRLRPAEGFENALGARATGIVQAFEGVAGGHRPAVAGQGVQVGQGQPANRRAQHRQHRGGVGRVGDGACDRQQVLDHRSGQQGIELDRPVAHAVALQRRQDVGQVRARPHDDRRGEVRVVATFFDGPGDAPGQGIGFRGAVGPGQDLDAAAGLAAGLRGRVAHRPGGDVLFDGKDRTEPLVDPVDDLGRRAEIARQAAGFDGLRADALIAGAHEQADLGLPESIDRLHRVADQEQAAFLARLPAADELLEQVVLPPVGVLVLVDQDVANAPIEVQGQVGVAAFFVAQAAQRRRTDAGEVALAGFGEDQLQFGRGGLENPDHGREHVPFFVAVARVGQGAGAVDPGCQRLVVAQAIEERDEAFLVLALGRKALVLVGAGPPAAAVGQQGETQRAPGRTVGRVGAGQAGEIAVVEGRGLAVGGQAAGGLAQDVQQVFRIDGSAVQRRV